MFYFFVALATAYGLVIGSFLNAVIYRVPRKESLNTRSHCPNCNAMIKWYQNIPLASFCALRGKCAACHTPIHWRYPAVELAGAVSFGVVAAWFGSQLELASLPLTLAVIGLCWFAAAGIALSLIDFELQLLPNAIVYPTLFAMIALLGGSSIASGDVGQLARAFAGLVVLGAFYAALWIVKPGAMGFGDVRLSLVLGFVLAWFSWGLLALGTFVAFALASVWGLALMAKHGANGKTALPFGPWMIAGAWTSLFVGAPLIDMYLRLGGLR